MKIVVEKWTTEIIKIEISPCFCCGNTTLRVVRAGLSYQAYCQSCSARGGSADTPKKAIELYNWISKNIDPTEAYLNYHSTR